MPTYEFRCPEGHEFEKFYRKISDAVAELPCPECGKLAMRLVSGGAGLLFKGSGFYLTDYGKNAHRKAGPASGGDSGKSSSDSKTTEGSGGTSASESKSTESKSTESKSTDAKPSEAKGATEAKPAKKPSSGSSNSSS